MNKKFLVLALLITGFLLAGNAYGEDEIYYCAEIDNNGFYFNEESSAYQRARFSTKKFKMKLDLDANQIELATESSQEPLKRQIYSCRIPWPGNSSLMACGDITGPYTFTFNPGTGRFVRSINSGYVLKDGDSLHISYGKCDKF